MKDNNWTSITVNERLFEGRTKELLLNNYPHIQFIHIQRESFERISNMTISNLPELKSIVFEDNSFYYTTSFTLSSIFYLMFI